MLNSPNLRLAISASDAGRLDLADRLHSFADAIDPRQLHDTRRRRYCAARRSAVRQAAKFAPDHAGGDLPREKMRGMRVSQKRLRLPYRDGSPGGKAGQFTAPRPRAASYVRCHWRPCHRSRRWLQRVLATRRMTCSPTYEERSPTHPDQSEAACPSTTFPVGSEDATRK